MLEGDVPSGVMVALPVPVRFVALLQASRALAVGLGAIKLAARLLGDPAGRAREPVRVLRLELSRRFHLAVLVAGVLVTSAAVFQVAFQVLELSFYQEWLVGGVIGSGVVLIHGAGWSPGLATLSSRATGSS